MMLSIDVALPFFKTVSFFQLNLAKSLKKLLALHYFYYTSEPLFFLFSGLYLPPLSLLHALLSPSIFPFQRRLYV